MDASYIGINEIIIRINEEEIEELESGSRIEGEIWIHVSEFEPHKMPFELYMTDGPYWVGQSHPDFPKFTDLPYDTKRYEVGIPPQGLSILKEGRKCIGADWIQRRVDFRKVWVELEGVIY